MRKVLMTAFAASVVVSAQVDWRQIKNKPTAYATDFTWSRTNGLDASANLSSSGAGKVITLVPGPKGMAAGDYVYVSGGTGTAEPALVTSTACSTAGGANCTITVTTANVHSGSWSVGTATAGVQEAVFSLPQDVTWPGYHAGTVVIPDGTYTMHAGVSVFLHMVTIRGASRGGTKLIFDSTIPNEAFYYTCDSQDTNVDRNRIGLHDLTIQNLSTTKDSVVFDNYSNAAEILSNVNIHGGRRAIYSKQTSTANFHDIRVSGFQTHGIYEDVTGGQGENNWSNILITSPAVPNTTIGMYVVSTSGAALAGTTYIFGMRIFGAYDHGVFVESTAGLQSVYFFANQLVVDGTQATAGIKFKDVQNVQIGESWFSNGFSSGGGTNQSYGALLDGTSLISFSNTVFGAATGVGGDIYFKNAPSLTQIIGCKFGGGYIALRFDLVNKPTKLVLKGNVQVNPGAELWVHPSEYDGLLNGTQLTTMDSPVMYQMGGSSLSDFTLQNLDAGDTTPTKYLRVNNVGCLEWLNSAHLGVIWKLCDDGKLTLKTTTFSALGSASAAGAGTEIYCTDCTTAGTCAGSGSGHRAQSNGTIWKCD